MKGEENSIRTCTKSMHLFPSKGFHKPVFLWLNGIPFCGHSCPFLLFQTFHTKASPFVKQFSSFLLLMCSYFSILNAYFSPKRSPFWPLCYSPKKYLCRLTHTCTDPFRVMFVADGPDSTTFEADLYSTVVTVVTYLIPVRTTIENLWEPPSFIHRSLLKKFISKHFCTFFFAQFFLFVTWWLSLQFRHVAQLRIFL